MVKERPIIRMLLYVGTKMETLELCYGIPQSEGGYEWKTEMAKYEHSILLEIHKTLSLVSAHEAEFKRALQAKLKPKAKR